MTGAHSRNVAGCLRKALRTSLAVTTLGLTALGLALGLAPGAGAGGAASSPTCSQLTKAQVQPLLVHRVTKLTVTPVPGVLYLSSAKQVGQRCVFSDTQTSAALVVTVVGGPSAARAYESELHSLGHSPARVPVVSGGKGVRARADSRGSVSTAEVGAIKGSTYCAVTPQEGETPGEARLEQAAGNTSDIGDKAYSDIAAAIGTLCNRIYGSGNTNPAAALSALKKLKPGHTGGGGITVPKLPPVPKGP